MKEHKYVNFSQDYDVNYIINRYPKKAHDTVKEYLETLKSQKNLTHEDVFSLIEKNLKLKKTTK